MRTATIAIAVSIASLSATLDAQGDFDFDKVTPATFGGTLRLDYRGAPASKPMMFMVSGNGGPTPLTLLFGGSDPRQLGVGVDLVPVWLLLATSPTGQGGFSLGVPTMAALQGLPLHVQLMTGGGAGPHLVDKISNKVVVVAGAAGSADILPTRLGDGRTPLGPGRAMMTVSPIRGRHGSLLLAGGGTGNILGAKGLQTTEIFDPRTLTCTPGPDLGVARALHTATTLKDGRILIAGGVDAGSSTTSGNPVASCEIYDPATNRFTPTAAMSVARAGHGATLLADGRVLVAAGTKELSDVAKAINGMLNTCEIYDPARGTWTRTASITEKVIGPSLTTLGNGRVLVAGGAKVNFGLFNIPLSVTSVTRCQLYDPTTGSWSNTGSMRQSRAVHGTNTLRLLDGRVLVTGGVAVNINLLPPPSNFAGAVATDRCEVYDPSSGAWAALPNLASARFSHTADLLPNGRVLVAGGGRGAIDAAVSVTSIQEFDPSTNTFRRSFSLRAGRAAHGSALLTSGEVAVFGGITSSTAAQTLRTVELLHH